MAERLMLPPAALLIDEENPRIAQPNTGQHKALQALARHLGAKLLILAEDIVNHGTDPSSLPIVTSHAGSETRFVVLEGNRRLAALRTLENPEAVAGAVSDATLKRLRRLSRAYQDNPIDELLCVVMDHEEARHWIELKHTGENAGAGVVKWGSDEASRYRYRTGAREPHTQALDFLERRGDLSADERKRVPATSLKRLIETPVVREKLGLTLEKKVLKTSADEDLVARALMYVVTDLTERGVNVGDIYTVEKRTKYARGIPSTVAVTKPGSGPTHALQELGAPATQGTASGRRATRRIPRQRDHLIPRDCVIAIPRGRVQEIESELRRLSLTDHANAVSVLFRVFLELGVDTYIENHFGAMPRDDRTALQKKVTRVLDDLLSQKKLTAKQATPVRRACERDSFLAPSLTLLHEYVHNPHVFPAGGDLRSYWDNLQSFIVGIWKP